MTRINGAAPQPAPQIKAMPAPVETSIGTAQGSDGEGNPVTYVILLMQSVNGEFGFFLSPEHANTLSQQLAEVAATTSTGLIIPSLVPPSL